MSAAARSSRNLSHDSRRGISSEACHDRRAAGPALKTQPWAAEEASKSKSGKSSDLSGEDVGLEGGLDLDNEDWDDVFVEYENSAVVREEGLLHNIKLARAIAEIIAMRTTLQRGGAGHVPCSLIFG
jgi:hypothetical protein